jgi:CBS domain-containing protein
MTMRVEDVMTTDVIGVQPTTSLKEVAGILVQHKISGLPVVAADGAVVGVVSEGDILFKERGPSERKGRLSWLLEPYGMEGRQKLEAHLAGEAMTAPAITIAPRRSVAEAARLMLEKRVNRLPVVDDEGTLIGIVTRADLVRAFARPDEAIEQEIRQDVLQHQMWLRDPAAVRVTVDGGKVTLSGTVDTRSDAEVAPVLVARVPGVVEVDSAVTWLYDVEGRS